MYYGNLDKSHSFYHNLPVGIMGGHPRIVLPTMK